MDDRTVIELTADIVGAYVANNRLAGSEVSQIIAMVASALRDIEHPTQEGPPPLAKPTPTQVRRSIRPDAIVSFIDARPYRLLTRHVKQHGYTPETYRQAFGLPVDYPMTAPDYAAQRSAMAKASGLGLRISAKRPASPLHES